MLTSLRTLFARPSSTKGTGTGPMRTVVTQAALSADKESIKAAIGARYVRRSVFLGLTTHTHTHHPHLPHHYHLYLSLFFPFSPVVIFSKTYCPYCSEAKSLFQSLGVAADIYELDVISGGSAIQSTLQGISGMRTVPQVFIGGELIGGCDDTFAAKSSGKLDAALKAAGVTA